jgi:DNA-binding NtrC family response regulator
LFQEDPARFDVVITDQVMPGLTGTDLARAMLAVRSELPVILCTGFSTTITSQQARELGIREFLMKPLVTRQLAESLRRVLDARPTVAVT